MANTMKSSHLISLALAIGGFTAIACGSGGPGTLTLGSGYDPVQHSSVDGPAAATGGTTGTGTGTGTTKGDDDDDSTKPVTTPDAGTTTTPTNCPTCQTYSCTGPAGTGDVTLAKGANDACTTTVNDEPISIACGNKITAADGSSVGQWAAQGNTLVVQLTTTDGQQTINCTKK